MPVHMHSVAPMRAATVKRAWGFNPGDLNGVAGLGPR